MSKEMIYPKDYSCPIKNYGCQGLECMLWQPGADWNKQKGCCAINRIAQDLGEYLKKLK